MTTKDDLIAMLGTELYKQKEIFKANAYRGTNPDGSDEYWAAKAKFDAADRKIKSLEKELQDCKLKKKHMIPLSGTKLVITGRNSQATMTSPKIVSQQVFGDRFS